MELLFVGVASTEDAIKESNRKYYKNKDQVRPQQYFDLTLLDGLSNYANVEAISIPPVASYPKSTCLFYRRKKDKISKKLSIKYITLLNFPVIKTIIIMFLIFYSVLMFGLSNRKKNPAILMGFISFYTAFPALIAARLSGVKINTVVPDVPQFISTYTQITNILRSTLTKLAVKLEHIIEHKFDGYVFLTSAMNDLINPNKKPFIVIEGMIKKEDFLFPENAVKEENKVLMYAGTLHKKFGIKKLVEAFDLCNLSSCELWIFGTGDYLDELKEIHLKKPNIKYKGTASRSEIIEYERRATLLVNPRPTDEEYTKYSFPSKTLEYMGSGTPLLTTKLNGIPNEYFNYVYCFENEEPFQMAKKMKYVMTLPETQLVEFGEKARGFVLETKNNQVQAKKIYSFLRSLL